MKLTTLEVLLGIVFIAMLVLMPFVIYDDSLTLVLYNLLMALITAIISVYASKKYLPNKEREDLTRYGLQAWRNLESLSVKMIKEKYDQTIDDNMLDGWMLDVDQAKLAWQDLLADVFDLQKRLQVETTELSINYREELSKASNNDARTRIEAEHSRKLAKLISLAPLPLKVPVEVNCPDCKAAVYTQLGVNQGDTAWPICPKCETKFPIHRLADGAVTVGGGAGKMQTESNCPNCNAKIAMRLPNTHDVQFLKVCVNCGTHIQVMGRADEFETVDFGVTNTEIKCPSCNASQEIWITPHEEKVRFLKNCKECNKLYEVIGNKYDYEVVEK